MTIAKVFFDVSMNLGLAGLQEYARNKRTRLTAGSFLLFMNRKRSHVKVLFDEHSMFVYKKSTGQITLEELRAMPAAIRGEWVGDNIGRQVASWLESPVTKVGEVK